MRFAIGPEAAVDISIQADGKVHMVAEYKGQDDIAVKLEVVGGPKPALEYLKGKIPGQIDDVVIDAIEAFLGLKA